MKIWDSYKSKTVLAISVRQKGQRTTVVTMDLSRPNAAEELRTQTDDKGLEIDMLINNAGYGRWGGFEEFGCGDYQKMIQLNITALTELCHVYLPDMVARKSGGIINVASVAAFGPVPYGNVYSATKSYVLTFTEALNFEYKKKGVHIMALCPGATESEFMKVATEKSADVRKNAEKRTSSMNYLPSAEVAKDCLDSFLNGKIYRITGRNNRIMYAFGRHFSRRAMLNINGNMFQRVVKNG